MKLALAILASWGDQDSELDRGWLASRGEGRQGGQPGQGISPRLRRTVAWADVLGDVHVGYGKIAGAAHRRHDGTAPTARQGLLPRFVKPKDARAAEYLDGSVRVGYTNPSSERIRTWLY
jgi:hypothetical protein